MEDTSKSSNIISLGETSDGQISMKKINSEFYISRITLAKSGNQESLPVKNFRYTKYRWLVLILILLS